MRYLLTILTLFFSLSFFSQAQTVEDDFNYDGTIATDPVFDNLVWSDEFDVNGVINSTNWFHQTQLPAGGSWYNGEVQHYTNRVDNSYVSDGFLNIVRFFDYCILCNLHSPFSNHPHVKYSCASVA